MSKSKAKPFPSKLQERWSTLIKFPLDGSVRMRFPRGLIRDKEEMLLFGSIAKEFMDNFFIALRDKRVAERKKVESPSSDTCH